MAGNEKRKMNGERVENSLMSVTINDEKVEK
jgi:hypothetical protein